MSVATMLDQSTHENVIPVRRTALAANDPGSPPGAILALDLGQTTGWAEATSETSVGGRVEWRGVPDWPDYEVSEWGDVRRLTPGRRYRAGTILTPFYRDNGYAQIVLRANGRRRRFLIHRLVAIAFLEPQPSPAHEIAHVNGCRVHNHHSNLRWVLHRENEEHKHKHGTRQRGSRVGTARLNEEQVRTIKAELRAGKTQVEFAARFGVHHSTISLIARGQFWRHVR